MNSTESVRSSTGCDPTSLTIEVVRSPEALQALQTEWNALLAHATAPTIFMSWDWIWNWWETLGRGLRPWIVLVRDSRRNELLGVAPFAIRPYPLRPWRELVLLGTTIASGDHLDLLARGGAERLVAAATASCLQQNRHAWDVLALDRMASNSPLIELLLQQCRRPTMQWTTVCPLLRITGGWEDYLKTLSGSMRYNMRRHADRLWRDAQGAVDCQYVRSRELVPAAMEELFRLHQLMWEMRGERGAFHSAAVRKFHHRVAMRFFEANRLRLYLLRVRAETVAALYCFRYGDTVSFYQSGYDPKWARYSPGEAVMANGIRNSIEEGAREFDFLRGAEPYKARWTRFARHDRRLRIPTTNRGTVAVLSYQIVHGMKSWYRRQSRNAPYDEGIFEVIPSREPLGPQPCSALSEGHKYESACI